jgi:hypothetical protein
MSRSKRVIIHLNVFGYKDVVYPIPLSSILETISKNSLSHTDEANCPIRHDFRI